MSKIISAHSTGTFIYHNDHEVEVPDDATQEDITTALEEAAKQGIQDVAQFYQGLSPTFEFDIEDDEEDEGDEEETTQEPVEVPVICTCEEPTCNGKYDLAFCEFQPGALAGTDATKPVPALIEAVEALLGDIEDREEDVYLEEEDEEEDDPEHTEGKRVIALRRISAALAKVKKQLLG